MALSERAVDWGASGRTDQYWFAIVDPFTLQEVDTAVVKEGASRITWSYGSENECEASLEMVDSTYLGENGVHYMVRPIHSVTIGDFCQRYAMGTFFVSNLTNSSVHHVATRRLTCYGPWYRYTQDVLPSDWVRHVGDNVVDGIRHIVESNGGHLSVEPGVDLGRKHTMDFINVAGTNLGEMLRVFAGWINCEIVSDFDGRLVLRPYESPYTKAPVYTFEDGRNCVYVSGLDWEVNRDEPINRVVAYFSREKKQDDDPYPLSDSVCVDVPPADAYSYDLTGRHRTQVIQVTEACSHEDLTAQAQRALDERAGGVMSIKIQHAGIPWLRVGDCVTYRNSNDDSNPSLVSVGIIQEMSVDGLGPMCMTTTKIRCYR